MKTFPSLFLGAGLLGLTVLVAAPFSAAIAGEQEAIDGCIAKLRSLGLPDSQSGEVLSTDVSEAAILVRLRDLGESLWDCRASSDGTVESLTVVSAADDGGGAMAGASGGAAGLPLSPDNGGPRRFEVTGVSTSLNLRAEPSTTAEVLASLKPGEILTNLGCQNAEDRTWCQVQPMQGGPVGYAAVAYLSPARGPNGDIPTGYDDSAARAGQGDFDATGTLPCASEPGQPSGPCDFGVARGTGGDATVVVTKPDGSKRAIFFVQGEAMGADSSQADGYGPFSVSRESDLNLIRVGDERYEIPDAVPLGG